MPDRKLKGLIVVEGEKAADYVNGLKADYHAITTPGGANSAHKPDWQTMPEGLPVILWPDNDPNGEKYAGEVMKALQNAGKWPAKGLKRIQPPAHWPAKFDAADLIEQAGDNGKAVQAILKDISDYARPVDRPQEQSKTNADVLHEIGLRPASKIEIQNYG